MALALAPEPNPFDQFKTPPFHHSTAGRKKINKLKQKADLMKFKSREDLKKLNDLQRYRIETNRILKMTKEEELKLKQENEERKKEAERKSQAQALKYLRKLGRKLKRPISLLKAVS